MITIHKYLFQIESEFTLLLPYLPQFLSCQLQHNQPVMWFQVDDSQPLQTFHFKIFGTGHDIGDYRYIRYMETLQMPDNLVWHIFQDFKHYPKVDE